MDILSKIDFKQPKYMLPAILYIPILFTGYFTIDMFNTEKVEIVNPEMETTEFINPNLPKAQIDDKLEGKYESMLKSYGKINDLSAIGNIERDDSEQSKEQYESKYSDSDIASMDSTAMEDAKNKIILIQSQEKLRTNIPTEKLITQSDRADILSEEENINRSRMRELELQTEIDRLRKEAARGVKMASETKTSSNDGQKAPSSEDKTYEVTKKIEVTSDYFNTIIANKEQEVDIIKAMIDEDIKAVDGSRVRLKLLDDITVGETVLPKGKYIYAIMSGFASQRVKGQISSVLHDDEIIKVNLSIYDMDGMEGMYVPQSNFRETAKDIASSTLGTNMNFNQGGYSDSFSEWGMQAIQNAYQKTSNAVTKAIKKNSAKLKYGTYVYLVNGKN